MQRINSTNMATLPNGGNGFKMKNVGAGISGTTMTDVWCNNVQEEFMTFLTKLNITPDDTKFDQVYTAVQMMIAAANTDTTVVSGNQIYNKSPSGLITQAGTGTMPANTGSGSVTFLSPFPNKLFGVTANVISFVDSNGGYWDAVDYLEIYSVTKNSSNQATGFVVVDANNANQTPTAPGTFYWVAIGN